MAEGGWYCYICERLGGVKGSAAPEEAAKAVNNTCEAAMMATEAAAEDKDKTLAALAGTGARMHAARDAADEACTALNALSGCVGRHSESHVASHP